MMRNTLILALFAGFMSFAAPAEAQKRGAQVTQGLTSGDLAANVTELRASNAELGARLTGLEADKAELSGQVETLEFLLSQSRDQINQMQSDDAEIGSLVGRLEQRLAAQDRQIKTLETRLDAIDASRNEAAAGFLNEGSGDVFETAGAVSDDGGADAGTQSVTSEARQAQSTSSGPTRIVRRTTMTGGNRVTTTGSEAPQDRADLPQGSLGTISASALPGDAGPLFAEAKSRLLQFDYAGAESAFRSFLDQFGSDPQAGEAQYWLGEVLYQQDAYAESGQAYTQMIRQYPDDPRAPEALAKLARSMRLVGDTEKACNALNILPQRYPDASGVTKNLAAGERVRSSCDS